MFNLKSARRIAIMGLSVMVLAGGTAVFATTDSADGTGTNGQTMAKKIKDTMSTAVEQVLEAKNNALGQMPSFKPAEDPTEDKTPEEWVDVKKADGEQSEAASDEGKSGDQAKKEDGQAMDGQAPADLNGEEPPAAKNLANGQMPSFKPDTEPEEDKVPLEGKDIVFDGDKGGQPQDMNGEAPKDENGKAPQDNQATQTIAKDMKAQLPTDSKDGQAPQGQTGNGNAGNMNGQAPQGQNGNGNAGNMNGQAPQGQNGNGNAGNMNGQAPQGTATDNNR